VVLRDPPSRPRREWKGFAINSAMCKAESMSTFAQMGVRLQFENIHLDTDKVT
jgi:hypothetical protein